MCVSTAAVSVVVQTVVFEAGGRVTRDDLHAMHTDWSAPHVCILCTRVVPNTGGVPREGVWVVSWACGWCVEDAVDRGVFSVKRYVLKVVHTR